MNHGAKKYLAVKELINCFVTMKLKYLSNCDISWDITWTLSEPPHVPVSTVML
jgi:hypothetical protein